jgi:hypothetical protein
MIKRFINGFIILLIKSGDAAVKVYEENNKVNMTLFPL